jgi:glycosyltransferase involved in cell wall biosynthesis
LKLPASLNRGFAAARGRYLTWTSDDNLLHPEFLETLLDELQKSGADLVYSSFNAIDDDGNFLNVSPAGEPEDLIYGNSIGASFLYKREVQEKLGGYDVTRFLYEDYDFWVRAYLSQFKFFKSSKVVYDYRRHKSSLTAQLKKPPNGYVEYVYGLRTKFLHVPRATAFEARRILTTWWPMLGVPRALATSAMVLERARTVPGRLPARLPACHEADHLLLPLRREASISDRSRA